MDERENLINALQIIKETCEKNGKCMMCPLGNDYDQCKVADDDTMPSQWSINQPDKKWKALL